MVFEEMVFKSTFLVSKLELGGDLEMSVLERISLMVFDRVMILRVLVFVDLSRLKELPSLPL